MLKRDFIRNAIIFLVFLLSLIILRLFVLMPYTITAHDANSYLRENDFVLASLREDIKYDDFVLYEVGGKSYVGRVVAKEADSATYMDDIFYLNNRIETEDYLADLRESYLSGTTNGSSFTHDFTLSTLTDSDITTIPKGQFLILNDNRKDMKDSRGFGLIRDSQIKGVIRFRLFPLSQFGFIENK